MPSSSSKPARRPYSPGDVLEDGESLHSRIALRDSAARVALQDKQPDAPKSIDEAVKLAIETQAKAQGMKPSEWLAQNAGDRLTKLIQEAAEAHVATAGAAGVTAAFSLDRCAMGVIRDFALADAAPQQPTLTADHGAAQAAYITRAAMAKDELRNGWRRQHAATA